MIEVKIEYPNSALLSVLAAIGHTPSHLNPQWFSEDEDGKRQRMSHFDASMHRMFTECAGFFLFSEAAAYGFTARAESFKLYIVDLADDDAECLFDILAELDLTFGHAADREEYLHRNQLVGEKPFGSVETWVGRNLSRYIPGVYWRTAISRDLVEKLRLPIGDLKEVADDYLGSRPDCYVFRFFYRARDWKSHANRLDRLCEETEGIFSIGDARRAFESAEAFMDVMSVSHTWP